MAYDYDSGVAAGADALVTALEAFLTGTPAWTTLFDDTYDNAREGNLGASRELWLSAPSTTSTPYHVGMRIGHENLTPGFRNLRFNVIPDDPGALDPVGVAFEEQGPGGGWIPNDGSTTRGFPRLILPSGSANIDYEFAADADHCRILVRTAGLSGAPQIAYLGALNPVGPDVDDASHWPWPVMVAGSAWKETDNTTGNDLHWFLGTGAGDPGTDYANAYVYRGGALRLGKLASSGAPGRFWTTWARATGSSKVGLTPAGEVFTMEGHVIESVSNQNEGLLGSLRGIRYVPHLVTGGLLDDNTVLGTAPDPVYVVVKDLSANTSDLGASLCAFLRTE